MQSANGLSYDERATKIHDTFVNSDTSQFVDNDNDNENKINSYCGIRSRHTETSGSGR